MKWLLNNWDQVAVALGEHIVISFTSVAIAFALSIVIGIWAARDERVFRWAIAVSGFLYTIPTLAFLALLIPIVGLGKANAIICMVAFSLMILIRNVATGIREVPADGDRECNGDAERGRGERDVGEQRVEEAAGMGDDELPGFDEQHRAAAVQPARRRSSRSIWARPRSAVTASAQAVRAPAQILGAWLLLMPLKISVPRPPALT